MVMECIEYKQRGKFGLIERTGTQCRYAHVRNEGEEGGRQDGIGGEEREEPANHTLGYGLRESAKPTWRAASGRGRRESRRGGWG